MVFQMVDLTTVYLWADLRERLDFEGQGRGMIPTKTIPIFHRLHLLVKLLNTSAPPLYFYTVLECPLLHLIQLTRQLSQLLLILLQNLLSVLKLFLQPQLLHLQCLIFHHELLTLFILLLEIFQLLLSLMQPHTFASLKLQFMLNLRQLSLMILR